ncbi:CKLF-like MARVEL transmembrane domain-containing protein 3 [Mastacembelus armatus]|uniref:CKLF-like MARVEL transmembrane domain-containing protein 3 n=1 Tax=Mastacembelus armatus TaxID=205130 RepID=UPI000E45B942|nr:CKLF-like MARVEL transmembrane domain-containing protein 3 [Mastacembelus armatus]
MEVDIAFLKSKRGILKLAAMGSLLVAFVCFAVGSRPKYITATVLEFLITLLLFLLYLFKLNKRVTFFFWPLVDVFNSIFAAVYFIVLSLVALTTYTVTGTLAGGYFRCSLRYLTSEESSNNFFSTMGDIEAPNSNRPRQTALLSVLPSKEFASSRKGMLLIAEVALSLVSFVCFAASTAAAFVTVPLLEFLAALFLLFAYSTKFNERFKGFLWPLMDFMRCVTASIIFFVISIISVSKYTDGSSKAAGVFGFVATIVFALDFYVIFNELAGFLKQGGESTDEPSRQQDEFSDSDSD